MLIQELTREECLQMLEAMRLARLACALDNQPYVVPAYLAYYAPPGGDACLYGFTTAGQKVEWLRVNPLVCVEVDDVKSYNEWISVIVLGRYEELPRPGNECERLPARAEVSPGSNAGPHTTACGDEAHLAHQVLQSKGMWWEPASATWTARTHRESPEPFIPIYYKVRIDKITGHRATRDAQDAATDSVSPAPARRLGWLQRALTRFCGCTPSSNRALPED